MMPYSKITPRALGHVWVVGGGPSLHGFDFSKLHKSGVVIGVNKAAWLANADIGFSLDQHFSRMHRDDIASVIERGGDFVLSLPESENQAPIGGVTYVRRDRGGLSERADTIHGANSGFGALNLAYLMGARSIGLLGIDLDYSKEGATHFHEGYSWHSKDNHRYYDRYNLDFRKAAERLAECGVGVTNYVGTPKSKLDAFHAAPLEDIR